jgi:hypothetical protein
VGRASLSPFFRAKRVIECRPKTTVIDIPTIKNAFVYFVLFVVESAFQTGNTNEFANIGQCFREIVRCDVSVVVFPGGHFTRSWKRCSPI